MVEDTSAGIFKKKKGKERGKKVYMANSKLREVYLLVNSQLCMWHSSDIYYMPDVGTAG